jgi:maleate isomerase/arylmalonate decarboxylase
MVGRAVSIGMIVPTTNTVNQAEWQRMAPLFRFPLVRMALHAHADAALYDDLRKALGELGASQPAVIAYACTAGSMVQPLDALAQFIERASGTKGVATAPALVHACRALRLRRVALATPYHDALNEHERAFFAANGIEVVSMQGLGIGAGGAHEYVQIARVPKDRVYRHCRSVDVPEADGMVISCTDFPTLEAIPRLEAALGKPVISSNTATFWHALRSAGIADRFAGFGRLLEAH